MIMTKMEWTILILMILNVVFAVGNIIVGEYGLASVNFFGAAFSFYSLRNVWQRF